MRFATLVIALSTILTAVLSAPNAAGSLHARQEVVVVNDQPPLRVSLRMIDLEDQLELFQIQLNAAIPGTQPFTRFTQRFQAAQRELQRLRASFSVNEPASTASPIPLPSNSVPSRSTTASSEPTLASETIDTTTTLPPSTVATTVLSTSVVTSDTTSTEQQGTPIVVLTSQATTILPDTSTSARATSTAQRPATFVISQTIVSSTLGPLPTEVATTTGIPAPSQSATRLEMSGNSTLDGMSIIPSGASAQVENTWRGVAAALVLGFWLWVG